MPADGWYQVAPLGEFEHAQAGVVQVVDQAACEAMANRFGEEAKADNFAGVLVDFDHFSLDGEKKSEAAGWITALEARCEGAGEVFNAETQRRRGEGERPKAEGGRLKVEEGERSTLNSQRSTSNGEGLWGKIRWSDIGEEAVKGGRYRFLSPVWRRGECEELGNGRLRPMRLHNAAVTNDPNLKGLRPLSNSGQLAGGSGQWGSVGSGQLAGGSAPPRNKGTNVDFSGGAKIANENSNATGTGNELLPTAHCTLPTEAKRLEWVLGDGEKHCPGCAALAGQVHTKEMWDKAGLHPGSGKTYCGAHCGCRLEPTDKAETGDLGEAPLRKEKDMDKVEKDGELINAEARETQRESDRLVVMENGGWQDAARAASLAVRRAKAAARKAAGDKDGKREAGASALKEATDALKKGGLDAQSKEIVDAQTEAIRAKLRRKKTLSKSEEAFLDALMDSGYAGESDSDPVFQWQEKRGEELDARDEEEKVKRDSRLLENQGWTDAARLASLAVRRAKSAARKVVDGLSGNGKKKGEEQKRADVKAQLDVYRDAAIDAFLEEYGKMPETDAEIAEAEEMAEVPEAYRTNGDPISQKDLIERILQGGVDGEVDGEVDGPEYTLPVMPETPAPPTDNDNWGWFLDEGLSGMSGDTIADMASDLAKKLETGASLGDVEQDFVEALNKKAAELLDKAWRGYTLTPDEKLIVDSLKGVSAPVAMGNRGWTDAARRASLAVRQAKAAARKAGDGGQGSGEDLNAEAQRRGDAEVGGGENEQARTPIPPEDDTGTVSDPPGGTGDYAERRSNLAAEIEDWNRRAYDAFVQKRGREPVSASDVIEAEALAGVPEKYCTGGDDVQAVVVADKVLWDADNQLAVGSGELTGDRKLANVWSDAARRAALEVRRMKAQARGVPVGSRQLAVGSGDGGVVPEPRTLPPMPPRMQRAAANGPTIEMPKRDWGEPGNPHYPVWPPVIDPPENWIYQPLVDVDGSRGRHTIPHGKRVPIRGVFGK